MPLRRLLRGLMAAWRRVKQGGYIQRVWRERVTASIRATEVTRRHSGWHPHLHVLLRTDEWSEEEKTELLEKWRRVVEAELGPECVPSVEHGIRWSRELDACNADERERARYLAELGFELTGFAKESGRRGSLSMWQIADLATRGDTRGQIWWREFVEATKGRRMIELDDRANRFANNKQWAPLNVNLAEPLDATPESVVTISVDTLELRALREYERRFDPGITHAIIESVQRSERPETEVRAWLDLVTACLGYTPRDGQARSRPEEKPRTADEARGPPAREDEGARGGEP